MNNFPISVAQIAEGMNNASSALHAAGNSFEESVALLTAANTTLQNASKSSTGMRTIAARLRNTKAELDDLGESMTQATYDELVSALTKYNVALTDANGDFRSTYDIMSDISKVWDDLTSQEQAGLATAIAGVRQQDVFYSLVENFNEASGAMDAMANSAGALQIAYDTYMQSTTAHINQFKAAFQTVAQNTFTRDFLNGAVDFGRHLLEIFNGVQKVINAIGGLNAVLLTTVGLVTIIKADSIVALLTKIITSITAITTAVKGFWTVFAINAGGGGLLATIKNLPKALSATGAAIASTMSTAQIAILGIVAAIAAVAIIWKQWEKAHPTLDQLKKDLSEMESEAESLQSELDNNNARIQELQALKATGSITAGEQAELERLQRENELIAQQIELQTQLISIKKQEIHDKAASDASDFLSKTTPYKEYRGGSIGVDETEGVAGLYRAIDEYETATLNLQKAQDNLEQAIQDNDQKEISKYRNQIEQYSKDRADAYSKIIDFQSQLVELRRSLDATSPEDAEMVGQIDHLLDVIMKYSDAADMLNDSASKNREAVANLLSGQDLEASTEKAVAAAKELNGLSINDLISQFPELATAASDAGIGLSDVIDMINSMAGTINVDEVKSQIRDAFDFKDVETSSKSELSNISENFLYYLDEIQNAYSGGFDLNRTVFGNIDTNNRQVLEWTEENVERYRQALESWGNVADDFLGSYSTVDGMSYEFGNVEIAFSPMLQTDHGAEFLDKNTVMNYIGSLIDAASADDGQWSNDEIFKLDAKGLEVDGKRIKRLIADIGETAIETGEAMHYTGKDGSIITAMREIGAEASAAGMSVEDYVRQQAALIASDQETAESMTKMKDSILAATDAGFGFDGLLDSIMSGEKQQSFSEWIDSLSIDDLKILYEVTKSPDSGAWGFDELKQHFEEAKESAKQGANEIADSMTKAAESTKTHLSQINAVKEALASQSTGKSISYDTFNSEELKGFSAALEYNNGALQLNAEKVRELVQAKSEEQIAFNNSQKALLQTDYLRNVAEIQSLRDALKGVDEGSAEFLDIQGQINVLLNRNEGISNQCAQYDLLSQSLREATDAYHNWLNAQNASESGDMFDDAVNAMKHINETLNDSDSDFFGRIGREDYKAAVDFIVPDSIDHEDEEKVKSYMQSISDMFTYDDDGNINGLNKWNFVKKALDAGLLEQDGDDYKVVGQKTMEDFAEGLGMSLPLVQAMFGELQEFGVEFSWADEASKTMGDLAVEANEAAESLRGLEGNENIDIRLDVSDIEGKEGKIQALESTIKQMQGIKAKVGVDASEVQNANSVIEYCIAQKQLLERPAIMNVDTSALSDNMALVVGKLQEFQQLSNKLELQQALGLDTSEVEGKLASVQAEIQGIDPQITAQLGIDPASRETIQASIQGITPEVMVNFGINEDAIIGYSPEDKEATVTYNPDTSLLPESFVDLSRTVNYKANLSGLPTKLPPIYQEVIVRKTGDGSANGTAHAGGTAKAGGDWGTAPGGPTLVGELGREIVVDPHSGKWYTVGDTGAEFVHIPKGSIVFNHKQTEALLEYGYVTGRASALVGGTAMVTGGPGLGRLLTKYTKKPKTATSKSPSNTAQKSPKTSTGSGSSGSNKPAKSSGGGNAAKAAGSAFEDLYKQHQHLLAMDQESVEDYLAWLDGAYQAAYKSGQIKIDDFYKYEEEVYEKTKELLTKARNEYENEAELLQKKSVLAASMSDFDSVDDYMEQIVSNYKAMQKEVAKEAAWYREHGFSDTSDEVSELSSLWLDYRDNVVGAITDAYDALDKELENRITLTENWLEMALEGGDYDKIRQYSDDITAYITARQEALHEQAERLREMGYSDSSEEVSKLSDLWWDYEQQRRTMAVETWGKVVEAAKEAADEISNVYDTLKDAANEYASMGGYLTLETLESILELGPQYLQFLKDENGLWAIDKENIEKVIAAKTEDLALTNALAYVERLRLAMNKESGEDLEHLLYTTTQTANATWELVYSQLAMLGLNNDQYKAALHNINAIRSLANAAIKGIGMEANAFSDELNDMKDGLDDILGYVMDMLKQKTQDEVDALNDMKDSYGDIIDQQKKALDNSKKQADYQSDVAKKVKEIAKLQARINNLSQDTSRSAIAERAKLEEELAELQGELAETQADHIRETTEDVLDEKLKAYEEEQDAEIKKLEDSISSQEKLYQKAVAYIEEQGDNLINELIAWNTEYGSVINQEISDAWEHASKALQKYGGYLEAVKATTEAIAKIGNSSGTGGNYSFGEYEDFSAEVSQGNRDSMYEQIGTQILSAINSMRQNSAQYAALGGGAIATATPEQKRLVQANEDLAAGIGNLIGGKLTRGGDGYWYLPDGTNLYSIPLYQDAISIGRRYGKFHTGGIAGGNSTLKQDEMFALLKKGEAVFTEAQQSSLMKLIDFGKAVANKIVSLSPAANILSQSVQRMSDRGLGVSAGSISYEITVPVQIFPAQKLDDSEIKSLTSRISDSTIKKLNDDFSRRGIRRGAQLI